MPGYARTARTIFLVLLAFGAGMLWQRAVTPVGQGVHLSGDGAAQVAEAYFVWPAPTHTREAEYAPTQVVLLRRWQNLEGLEWLARLCGRACAGQTGVVTIRRPAPNGETRVILVNLGAHGAGAMLDAGEPIPEHILSCIVQGIEIARTDGQWKITKCDVPESSRITRPRLWSPQPPAPGFLRGL
ncbi:hypothetical protein [Jannaschia marina]|uniref:hypothetical protein n=1 Tax=Jannaschia marina TaxID=2741674 RepID=UPI0015CA7F25|nr:hypothetical protein [Jannaschia marina]